MVYLRSLDDQTQIPIEEGENLLVGRLDKCDVVINDPSVSSQHARVHLLDNVLRVVDMGSTNGTRVNYAHLIKPTVLMDGDTLEFGNVCFTIDGPELQDEQSPEKDSALQSEWRTLEASQRLDATMSISLPDEIEPITSKAPRPGRGDKEEVTQAVAVSSEHGEEAPTLVLTLLLLLLTAILLAVHLWTWTP